jgi:hypothetical protein
VNFGYALFESQSGQVFLVAAVQAARPLMRARAPEMLGSKPFLARNMQGIHPSKGKRFQLVNRSPYVQAGVLDTEEGTTWYSYKGQD